MAEQTLSTPSHTVALQRLRETAFEETTEHPVDRCELCDRPILKRRKITHTRTSHGFGADWDLEDALVFVAQAEQLGWHTSPMLREPVLIAKGNDGRVIMFDWVTPG